VRLAKRRQREQPLVELHAAFAGRILFALVATGDEAGE
jgi:hypothetical protein